MPTTDRGLPYPASTDPIRLGAQRIRELAVAVDGKLGASDQQLATSLAHIARDTETRLAQAVSTIEADFDARTKGDKGDKGAPGGSDEAFAGWVGDPESETARALAAKITTRDMLNIVDFGVVRGTAASQTSAILAAFAANPGKPFYFPPGDYRCDTSLVVTTGNSMRVDGRIYAGAAMDKLIDWDNGAVSASDYAQDEFVTGTGVLDAALLADTALAVGSVIRFPIEGLTFKDPIKRGLITKELGAEVLARNLRFHNTGTTNVADNVAIEANMGDSHFMHIVTRDFTIGVWDKNGNRWFEVHPWLGDAAQVAARYPTSVAFKFSKNSRFVTPYVDTYRYGFQGTGTYDTAIIISPEFLTNTGNLSGAIAAANLGAVFDLGSTGHRVHVSDGTYNGHPSAPIPLFTGNGRRFFHRDSVVRNAVTGGGDYAWGVKLGVTSFTPTIEGSTAPGSHTYTTQEGYLEIRGVTTGTGFAMAHYHFRVVCTIGEGAAGSLRIGNLPYPVGASATRGGVGNIARVAGGINATGLISGGVTPSGPPWVGGAQKAVLQVSASGATSEIPVPPTGTTVEFWGELLVPVVISTS